MITPVTSSVRSLQGGRASAMAGMEPENRVILNVSGTRFETTESTLKRVPGTRLARLKPSMPNYNPLLREYHFDRHPAVFSMVLNYYRTGKLHYPRNVCGTVFEDELSYWGVDYGSIQPCCVSTFARYRNVHDMLSVLGKLDPDANERPSAEETAKKFGWTDDYFAGRQSWWQETKPKLWTVFEEPQSSKSAKAIAVVSICFICASIIAFCFKTLPTFRIPKLDLCDVQHGHHNDHGLGQPEISPPILVQSELTNDASRAENSQSPGPKHGYCIQKLGTEPHIGFFYVDMICTIWFTVEFLIRLALCPSKLVFWRQPLTWVDFLACFSFYVDVAMKDYNSEIVDNNDDMIQFISAIRRFVRPVKLLRLFKLTQVSSGLKILVHVLRACAKELLVLSLILLIGAIVFAAVMYYAERRSGSALDEGFSSIPISLWWAITTMTTVGCGNMVPQTRLGMLVGAICAVSGVLTAALLVPIIVNNFSLVYCLTKVRSRVVRKRGVVRRRNAIRRRRTQREVDPNEPITQPNGRPDARPTVNSRHSTIVTRRRKSGTEWLAAPHNSSRRPSLNCFQSIMEADENTALLGNNNNLLTTPSPNNVRRYSDVSQSSSKAIMLNSPAGYLACAPMEPWIRGRAYSR